MENRSIRKAINKIYSWLQQNIRWFTRSLILAIFVLILFNISRPMILKKVGDWFGTAEPSLAAMIAVIILLFLLERVLLLEERLDRPRVKVYEARWAAYQDLDSILETCRIKKIDLIQFSSQTALWFLLKVVRRYPGVTIRMLVGSSTAAETYNRDVVDHAARIQATADSLRLAFEEHAGNTSRLCIRNYTTAASISSLVINDHIVVVGWYRVYYEDGNLRLRGHNLPAVMATGTEAVPLLTIAREQFDALWDKGAEQERATQII